MTAAFALGILIATRGREWDALQPEPDTLKSILRLQPLIIDDEAVV